MNVSSNGASQVNDPAAAIAVAGVKRALKNESNPALAILGAATGSPQANLRPGAGGKVDLSA